jgi:glutamyl-tRNA synthetase
MSSKKNPARVRFAPSPTGMFHIGSARTALYDFLIANQTAGSFILRIEDTDQKRYQEGSEANIMSSLEWLGLLPDEGPGLGGKHGPYIQSQRAELYREQAELLIQSDNAYRCFCTPERLSRIREQQQKNNLNPLYDGTCRKLSTDESSARVAAGKSYVVRFKTPKSGTTVCRDLLRGEIKVENSTLDDMVLIKSDGLALYHLAAIVDDHLMGITHVLRGSEWLPTFPIHVQIYRALGWDEPTWVHLSVLLKPDGKGKLSKRDNELAREQGLPIFVEDMEELGYIPEAVNNWIALMGWSYDDKSEFFTLDEMIKKFSLEKLNPSPAAINFSKLDHFNGLHIRSLDQAEFARRIKPWFESAGYSPDDDVLFAIAGSIQTRTKKLTEVVEMAGFFFQEDVKLEVDRIITEKMSPDKAAETAKRVLKLFQGLPEITQDTAEEKLREIAVDMDLKAGQVFSLLREALTGQKVSPPIFDIIPIIGRDKVLERLKNANEVLSTY